MLRIVISFVVAFAAVYGLFDVVVGIGRETVLGKDITIRSELWRYRV